MERIIKNNLLNEFVKGKGEPLTASKLRHTSVIDTRTKFNVLANRREYKLSKAYESVRNLEYRFEGKFVDQPFSEYIKLRKELFQHQLDANEIERPEYSEDEKYRNHFTRRHYPKGHMLVLVDSNIFPAVKAALDRYVLDVGLDGYWATVHIVNGGTPQQVRSYIKSKDPVGAFLVGAIAAPWYEHDGSQFPCDLYYMDTNGTWTDPDGDGRFESHSGDLDPETWIGRLYTPTESGNDADLINDYFARNHRFRLGDLGHARSALAYVDDDWQGFDDCAFDEIFPSSVITKYTNPDTTDSDLYKAEVNELRSWTQLCAHSWTTGHAFSVSTGTEYINNSYFRDTNPPNSHFYNLFCCGPGKYTTSGYLGGWYIFDASGGGTNHGMAAIASAKSGSMLYFEDFYRPMANGKAIGEAYLEWWKERGPDHDDGEKKWFYGLVLLGDPTLNWWNGNVPAPRQPQPDDTFDHWPRRMEFRWDPVNVPGTLYSLEVDAFGAINAGKWAEESGQTFATFHNLTGTTFDHQFVGAQRGRWRVTAKIGGRNCSWSPWQYFRFTV